MNMQDATPLGDGFGASPGPVTWATAVVDTLGIVRGWSAGAEALLGYAHEDAVGRPATGLLGLDAELAQRFAVMLGERDGPAAQGWTGTVRLRHRDGRHLEVGLRAYPSVDGAGNAQRLVVVTPPGQPEQPQEPEGNGITAEAFTQCHLPVSIYSAELLVLRASIGMVREVGLSEDRMRGRRISEILPPGMGEEIEACMRRVLETGEVELLEVHEVAPGGSRERVWSVTVSPLRNPAGRVHRVQLTALDTTDEYWARERLALLNDVSTRVGSTLDVMRTAQEMADVAVGRLADFISVDLVDSVFHGVEPRPIGVGEVALRRAAQQSVIPGAPESVVRPGEVDFYPEFSPPARCLATGEASLHPAMDEAMERWAAADPERAAKVGAYGIHSVMVIPLTARGIILGVAVLVRHQRTESFDENDLVIAEEIGARAAVSVDNARRFTRERNTALALQRSLLPQRLASQGAVQVAHRYLPTRSQAGVGGDWFDVIPLSGARVALVVGDVVGHGLRASATMGRLRTAVRTLADVDLPPDELLVHLDDLVTHLAAEEDTAADPSLEIVTDLIATCLYVVYDPVSRRCTAASAGHPPPAVVTPDGTASFMDIPPGPPLGMGGLPFETVERELPGGSLLALYTDGLVEARDHDLGKGLERLCRSLEQPPESLEAICDTLIQTLLPKQPMDDVALLVARTRTLDTSQVATWDLPSDPVAVAGARAEASRQFAAWGLQDFAFTAELVVSELVTNAIRYGSPPIQLRLIRDSVIICEVSDSSNSAPHLRRARSFDEGGRGLLLVAQFADRWGTRHLPAGKTIWAEIALPEEQV